MSDTGNQTRAEELLQELGLNEYEAKCFVALTALPKATAREISDLSDVPRTRVYDAIRVLESQGLAEVQHSTPQQFRAVPTEEAVQTLDDTYTSRVNELQQQLDALGETGQDQTDIVHEVWALSGEQAITNRTRNLIREATEEVVLVVGQGKVVGGILSDLREVSNECRLLVGVPTHDREISLQRQVPDANVFVSEYDWLTADYTGDDSAAINRMLLVDRGSFLVGSSAKQSNPAAERAVFGRGFSNGLVVIARRLLLSGLIPHESD